MTLARTIKTIPTGAGGSVAYALAWDGRFLWNGADGAIDTIYKVDPITGSVIHNIPAPGTSMRALTWDGRDLWVSNIFTGQIFKIDPNTGAIKQTISKDFPLGLAWDGRYLWCVDPINAVLAQIDPCTGSIVNTIPCDAEAFGVVYDGRSLWVTISFVPNYYIRQIDPRSGTVIQSSALIGNSLADIVWDGRTLWYSAYVENAIHQVHAN